MEKELNVIVGDSQSWAFVFKNKVTNRRIDITGYYLYINVKDSYATADNAAKVLKTITSLSNPTEGEAIISLTAAETKAITAGTYYYDMKYKKPDGTVVTILYGNMVFKPAVSTRAS